MVAQLKQNELSTVIYPETDGKQMADNTIQFHWITMIKTNLDWLFAENEQVFVAGDLLWYPVEGDNKIRQAPDILVFFGRPKGDRGSYQQWKEDHIPPQVVFEILSPSNSQKEMYRKLLFYNRYGVEEYYVYDPDHNELSGFLRGNEGLEVIEEIDGWVSPLLGIRFQLAEAKLNLYHPNGDRFSSYTQEKQRADKLAAKLKELGVSLEDSGS